MDALQVAVFALALAGGTTPFSCTVMGDTVVCDHGVTAIRNADGNIQFDTGVEVLTLQDGRIAFSNGVYTYWGSAGWVHFSNGPATRRLRKDLFRFSTGFECAATGPGSARCAKRK